MCITWLSSKRFTQKGMYIFTLYRTSVIILTPLLLHTHIHTTVKLCRKGVLQTKREAFFKKMCFEIFLKRGERWRAADVCRKRVPDFSCLNMERSVLAGGKGVVGWGGWWWGSLFFKLDLISCYCPLFNGLTCVRRDPPPPPSSQPLSKSHFNNPNAEEDTPKGSNSWRVVYGGLIIWSAYWDAIFELQLSPKWFETRHACVSGQKRIRKADKLQFHETSLSKAPK